MTFAFDLVGAQQTVTRPDCGAAAQTQTAAALMLKLPVLIPLQVSLTHDFQLLQC